MSLARTKWNIKKMFHCRNACKKASTRFHSFRSISFLSFFHFFFLFFFLHPLLDSIKDIVWSSVKVSEFDIHLKKAGGHIGRYIVEITIKMKIIVRKPLMIKIIKLRLRNLGNKYSIYSLLVCLVVCFLFVSLFLSFSSSLFLTSSSSTFYTFVFLYFFFIHILSSSFFHSFFLLHFTLFSPLFLL